MIVVAYFCFFFNDTATTEIYTLSLHDALPILLLYMRTQDGNDALTWIDDDGENVTQSQVRILEMARCEPGTQPDRKSTRLNSSHANISYAVFCLKKKKYIHI